MCKMRSTHSQLHCIQNVAKSLQLAQDAAPTLIVGSTADFLTLLRSPRHYTFLQSPLSCCARKPSDRPKVSIALHFNEAFWLFSSLQKVKLVFFWSSYLPGCPLALSVLCHAVELEPLMHLASVQSVALGTNSSSSITAFQSIAFTLQTLLLFLLL